jgi:hypothetical protein
MKKIFMFMAAVAMLCGCEQFEEIKDVQAVENISFGVEITLAKDANVPAPETYKVKLNNYAENIEIIKDVAAGNTIRIDDVIPGIYTVAISGESQANGFTYIFNGNLSNVNIIEDG